MRLIYLILSLILIINSSHSQADNTSHLNHNKFDSLLQLYVDDNGLVNYSAIKANSKLLDDYLAQLKNIDAEAFKKWDRKEQMAFWINAYNAITIAGIVRNYPIQYGNVINRMRFPKNSIRQISGFWDTVFIKVMNNDITLNQIEHEILRKRYRDPKIHMALVCAALGCPNLENKAFTAENLDKQLHQASRHFINNPNKVRLDQKENKLYVSSIFDWYKDDFIPVPESKNRFKKFDKGIRGIIEFLVKFLPRDQTEFIIQNTPGIEFLDYDWTLNEQK